MVRSYVRCCGIFPLAFALASATAACSSDSGARSDGVGGQAVIAGSAGMGVAGNGTGGSAAQGGSVAQGGSGAGSSGSMAGGAGGTGNAAGGSGGSAGSGGSSVAGSGGAAAGSGGAGGSGGSAPMLEPCSDPAVSRLKVWEMQVVGGTQLPANGSPLRKYDGGGYELYVEWTLTQGGAYGTANAPLNNQGQYTNGADPAKNAVDISKGSGLTLEYASTGSTYLQLRTGTVPHGGDHFRADLPSTDGQLKTIQLPYDSFRRPGGNTPPGNDILTDMFSFTFVGSATTKLTIRQVLIPGFVPPCN